jgi:hypothetical protein
VSGVFVDLSDLGMANVRGLRNVGRAASRQGMCGFSKWCMAVLLYSV